MSIGQVEDKVPLKRGGTRIGYIDSLKGFASLCVVLGHIANGYLEGNTYPEANQGLFCIFNAIYAFHMPLFMMISGYVYAVAYFDCENKPVRKRIYKQIVNTIIIYIIFSIPYGLIKVVLSRYTNKPVELTDLLLIWARPIDLYWYLYDLVLLYLLFIHPVLYKTDCRMTACILVCVAVLSHYIPISWFQIQNVLYYAVFFYIGFSGKFYPKWLIDNKRAVLGAAAVSLILCVVLWDKGPFVTKEEATCLNSIPIANVLIAGGISAMLWYLFQNVRCLSENRFLTLVGNYSLEIYVIHCFFTAGFRAVFSKICINDPFLGVALNFVLSTSIPVAIAMICKQLGIHELFFKPMSFIGKRKSEVS